MNTLTPQQLIFIDHYLESSGVEYADIRVEMTDHVASALEKQDGDFHENFKSYMLAHKQELLKSNRHFMRLATKRAFKAVGKTLVKPWFLALPFIIVYASSYFAKTISVNEVSDNLESIYIGLFLVSLLVSSNINRKFSVAIKVLNVPTFVLYIIHLLLPPIHVDGSPWISFLGFALIITLAVAILASFYSLNRKYKLQYR